MIIAAISNFTPYPESPRLCKPVLATSWKPSLVHPIVVDVRAKQIWFHGVKIWQQHGRHQFNAFVAFLLRPNVLVTIAELADAMWPEVDETPDYFMTIVQMTVRELRSQIAAIGLRIRTCWRRGYILEAA